ncbi:hypothetical protein J6590_096782 [Homalodisca vitripennis]|nr:hypothetical protein J6590_096782 [Homalodisca vitripennis]
MTRDFRSLQQHQIVYAALRRSPSHLICFIKDSVAPSCFWIVSVNIVVLLLVHLKRHEDTGCIMKIMSIIWKKNLFYHPIDKNGEHTSKYSPPASINLRRQFCHAWKAPWNSSTGTPFSILITSAGMFPTESQCFPISSLFSQWNENITRSYVRAVSRLGHHAGLVLCRVVGNYECRVARGIFVVELEDDFNIRPDASDMSFQSQAPADTGLRWQFFLAVQTQNGRFLERQRRLSALF